MKMQYVYTMEPYSVLKEKNVLINVIDEWMGLEKSTLYEITQKHKDKHSILSFICSL